MEALAIVLAILAAIAIGLAKTGVPGLGILVVPIFAWLCDGDVAVSAAALVPLLITADLVGVWTWRHEPVARRLLDLLPGVLAGMLLGWLLLRWGSEGPWLKRGVGVTVLAMAALQWWRRRHPELPAPGPIGTAGYALSAGTATIIANAAGPVMSLYLLARGLPKTAFLATGAWFFLGVNVAKIPLYGLNGQFGNTWLLRDLLLLPAVLLGCLIGRRLAQRIPQRRFESIVLGLAAVGGAWLLL
jgi:hypothetical protein